MYTTDIHPILQFFHSIMSYDRFDSKHVHVDVRDIGMVASFTPKTTPFGEWSLFIMETVNKHQSALDSCKVTDEGYTYYEARVYHDIQNFMRERSDVVITCEQLQAMEIAAAPHPDFYSRFAKQCVEYEKQHSA